VGTVKNEAFHKAVARLKSDGKLHHGGISCHGPREEGHDSMEKVLLAAVEDGRFDLMLLSYNFMNKDEAERVLAACKKADIGTTAMKTAPGAVELPEWDPENPTGPLLAYIERKEDEGQTREKSIQEIEEWLASQKEAYEKTAPFREKYGIKSPAELRVVAAKWVLQNPDMHTVCLGMRDFEQVDRFVELSGSRLTVADTRFLDDYRLAHNSLYCRHGCSECLGACSENVPVNTIMRYSYYFTGQGREKEAMGKYARLAMNNGARCLECTATSCDGACPHGLDIRANVLSAHSLLTIA
jgi:predicted aldo/keto reductase-like oxidoreductase